METNPVYFYVNSIGPDGFFSVCKSVSRTFRFYYLKPVSLSSSSYNTFRCKRKRSYKRYLFA